MEEAWLFEAFESGRKRGAEEGEGEGEEQTGEVARKRRKEKETTAAPVTASEPALTTEAAFNEMAAVEALLGSEGALVRTAAQEIITTAASSIGDASSSSSTNGAGEMFIELPPLAPPAESEVVEKPPAKVYKFTLDTFQREAIGYLERYESVLVSAHTSAGKTAVAEYAIAMALRDKQRVIYTSPIKALSNQKYRNLAEEFVDVGLMTGDVTINPNASCLVMTTEILRSMLYRGSEILREVAWVIFDEVHAMNDRERGVVWEESIVLLPHKVRYVFLSATIPNGREFAKWISKLHKQPCHVVYTDYRPTPLQHYVFPSGGEGLFLVVDEKGQFHEDHFEQAMASLADDVTTTLADQLEEGTAKNKAAKQQKNAKRKGKTGDLLRIVKMIMERRYDPVIIFSFSKRECEAYAVQVSKADLTNESEKALIEKIYVNAIDSLSNDDKTLPQVTSLLPLLQRGIGIHHGGLLPILKEVVEILFGEGLIKCLFATETFAMGVNMPAKTVVFTSCRKYDGSDFRWVGPGEYIQMSGRAGRRGLDERGIVIQMVDEKMDIGVAKTMMSGQADPLSSTFHLGYNMVLNLMRVEDVDPEFMVRHSLYMFQQEEALPALREKLERLRTLKQAIPLDPQIEPDITQFHHLGGQYSQFAISFLRVFSRPSVASRFLGRGRLVLIEGIIPTPTSPSNAIVDEASLVEDSVLSWRGDSFGWGAVVSLNNSANGGKSGSSRKIPNLLVSPLKVSPGSEVQSQEQTEGKRWIDVLVLCDRNSPENAPKPFVPSEMPERQAELRVLSCTLDCIHALGTIVLNLPKDVQSVDSRKQMAVTFKEVFRRLPNGIPLLDLVNDVGISSAEMQSQIVKLASLSRQLRENKFCTNEVTKHEKIKIYSSFLARSGLGAQARAVEKEIRKAQELPLKDTLKRMKAVLRRLGHIDKNNVIELKGRVACEISTADELLVTELLLGGVFNDLSPEICAALAACLVFDEKGEDTTPLKREFEAPYAVLQATAKRIAEVQKECQLSIEIDEYVERFRSDLMEVVFLWCRGAKFSQICEVTEAYEGTVIRSVRRLVELLRQLCGACKVIGDTNLETKFAQAIKMMQRDVIFSASLYL